MDIEDNTGSWNTGGWNTGDRKEHNRREQLLNIYQEGLTDILLEEA